MTDELEDNLPPLKSRFRDEDGFIRMGARPMY